MADYEKYRYTGQDVIVDKHDPPGYNNPRSFKPTAAHEGYDASPGTFRRSAAPGGYDGMLLTQ